ncbi:hypothetical protein BHM03_00046333 [Ensete ventricosum]|uniref:Uncharacterized protein n=1 Tax=Ensete ventricosum TaxID=4639 RepID=A0A445ML41_ENSVE|nr:hypothetical protein BHM03_00046333 [Ensete ventricosum]
MEVGADQGMEKVAALTVENMVGEEVVEVELATVVGMEVGADQGLEKVVDLGMEKVTAITVENMEGAGVVEVAMEVGADQGMEKVAALTVENMVGEEVELATVVGMEVGADQGMAQVAGLGMGKVGAITAEGMEGAAAVTSAVAMEMGTDQDMEKVVGPAKVVALMVEGTGRAVEVAAEGTVVEAAGGTRSPQSLCTRSYEALTWQQNTMARCCYIASPRCTL